MVIIQYRSVLVQRNPFFVNFVYEITDDLFLRLHAVVVGDRAARGPTLRVPGEYPPRPGGIQGCLFLPARGGGGLVSIRKSNWNSSMTSYRKGKGAGQTQISTLLCHVRTSARQETQWDLSSASFSFICFFLCLVKQGS